MEFKRCSNDVGETGKKAAKKKQGVISRALGLSMKSRIITVLILVSIAIVSGYHEAHLDRTRRPKVHLDQQHVKKGLIR
jgi:hypothetical protein